MKKTSMKTLSYKI